MRVFRVAVVLAGVTVVDRHRHRAMAQRIERAHFTPGVSFDLAVVAYGALVREHGRVELHRPLNALGIGVDEELVRVEPQAVMRVPCSVGAESVLQTVPCLVEMEVPQAIVRAGHLEQCLAQAERRHDARADRVMAHVVEEPVRCVIGQANRLVVERARFVHRLEHAQPQLFRGLRTYHDVRAAVIGVEESWSRGVSL